ncbi:MAG: iron-containing redox enzyme family protein [Bdellovibrionales bacterium]|nr:iron-containing redox enzyme family protein [Bdellovibrionales bacterium]
MLDKEIVKQELNKLVDGVKNSHALENSFYTMYLNKKLNPEQLKTFVLNYGEFVRSFPLVLKRLIQTTDDPVAKAEYEKTLFSEMGDGDPERVHYKLFINFYNDLARYMGLPEKSMDHRQLRIEGEVFPETKQLIDGEFDLYTKRNRSIAAGAQLAQEYQAYGMLTKIYEGSRQYVNLWPDLMEFHESAEYFHAHLGAAEKNHRHEALDGALNQINSDQDLADAKFGYHEHLKLFNCFWERLATELKS